MTPSEIVPQPGGMTQIHVHVLYSPADMCKNCAFDDTSMRFGTHLGDVLMHIFSYRAITDYSHDNSDGHLLICGVFHQYNVWTLVNHSICFKYHGLIKLVQAPQWPPSQIWPLMDMVAISPMAANGYYL